MWSIRSKKAPAAAKPKSVKASVARPQTQSVFSHLCSRLPCVGIAQQRTHSFTASPNAARRQQPDPGHPLPAKPDAQEECHVANPLQSQQSASYKENLAFAQPTESLPSELHDWPILMPEPLPSQAEKLRRAEDAANQLAQQLCSQEQKHSDALNKLSEQHELNQCLLEQQHQAAVQEIQSDSDRQLKQQHVAQEIAVACIKAQHATEIRQVSGRHAAALS